MRYSELAESPEADLAQLREATKLSQAFVGWLVDHNEHTPLGDVPGLVRVTFGQNTGKEGYIVSAYEVGLKDVDDLSFGFVWLKDGRRSSTKALLARGIRDGRRHYYAVFQLDHDPEKVTDIAFSLRWTSMTHELTHYLDYKRGFEKNGINTRRDDSLAARGDLSDGNLRAYFNDPLERNAYYQQAISEIVSQLVVWSHNEARHEQGEEVLASFDKFLDFCKGELRPDFQDFLTQENWRKLTRRLYKLYGYLKHHWPNLDRLNPDDTYLWG